MPPEDPIAAVAAPIAAPAPAPAPSPAPVAAPAPSPAPAAASVAEAPAGAVGSPVAEPPAVVEPTAPAEAAAALKPHTEQPGLLGTEAPAEGGAEKAPAAAAKPGEPAAAAAPDPAARPAAAPEPVRYEAPTLPDGITLDPEQLGRFDEVVGTARIAPEVRQQLVDMYVAERQSDAARTLQHQHDVFAETKANWAREAASDPEIGGSGFKTSIASADRMIRMFTSDANRPAFLDMLHATGADSHPEMVRFLAAVSKRFDEPAPPPAPHNPPPDIGRKPAGTSARQMRQFYDGPGSEKLTQR